MKALEALRASRASWKSSGPLRSRRWKAVATVAIEEERNLTDEESGSVDARRARHRQARRRARRAWTSVRPSWSPSRNGPRPSHRVPSLQVISKPDSIDVMQDRSATPQQLADALTRSVEDRVESPENLEHVRKLAIRHRGDTEWAWADRPIVGRVRVRLGQRSSPATRCPSPRGTDRSVDGDQRQRQLPRADAPGPDGHHHQRRNLERHPRTLLRRDAHPPR